MTERISVGQMFPAAAAPVGRRQPAAASQTTGAVKSFQELLNDKYVHFSHHAELRLKQRGIQLMPEQLAKLEQAIDKAASKGAKDSLMLMNDMALIVNVKNRTVVTAMDGAALKDNVFTQIDSAVIIS
jgi:flagellar operon protein